MEDSKPKPIIPLVQKWHSKSDAVMKFSYEKVHKKGKAIPILDES